MCSDIDDLGDDRNIQTLAPFTTAYEERNGVTNFQGASMYIKAMKHGGGGQ